jgi:hypothetical protein
VKIRGALESPDGRVRVEVVQDRRQHYYRVTVAQLVTPPGQVTDDEVDRLDATTALPVSVGERPTTCREWTR